MPSINLIRASDGTDNASVATVQSTRAPSATTISVDTVTGIPDYFYGSMGTPHTFTDPVTSETITVISEATAVDFKGHVDGTNLEIDAICPGYSDGGSSAGDIVIIKPITEWANNIADTLAVSLNDNGTIKNGAISSINMLASAVLSSIYPVGSVYTNATNSTNPGTLLGFGTWVAFGEGRVPVGKASSGTFGTIGATGGAETVTLTANQSGLRQHDHGIYDPGHYHQQNVATTGGAGTGISGTSNIVGNTGSTQDTSTYGTGITINNQGPWNAAEAHNNLQPYVVVYMWRRTA